MKGSILEPANEIEESLLELREQDELSERNHQETVTVDNPQEVSDHYIIVNSEPVEVIEPDNTINGECEESEILNPVSENSVEYLLNGDQPINMAELDKSCVLDPDSHLPVIQYRSVNFLQSDPVEFLMLTIGIKQQSIQALLDTGARISLITKSQVDRLGLRVDTQNKSVIYGIGGKEKKTYTLGTVNTPMDIAQLYFPEVTFQVVPDNCIDQPVFVGIDFFIRYGLTVNIHRKSIGYHDKIVNSRWELYLFPQGYKLIFNNLTCKAARNVKLNFRKEMVKVPVTINYPRYVSMSNHNKTDDIFFYEGVDVEENENIQGINSKVQTMAGIINVEDPHILVSSINPGVCKIKTNDILGVVSTLIVLEKQKDSDQINSVSDSQIGMEGLVKKMELGQQLTPEQREMVYQLVTQNQEVVSQGENDIGLINVGELKIELYDNTPVYHRPRRFPDPLSQEVDDQCKELLANDIIEPSASPYNCRILPIRKPNGALRLCMDYRDLNSKTKSDKFPMTNLTDSIFSLYGIQYFTTLDLVKGYYQLMVEPQSREYTAFSTNRGHWQYKRMPFGLKNAPAAFQRAMQTILQEFSRNKVIIYLDDILIISKDFEEHVYLVNKVLTTLRAHGIKINLEKCAWFKEQVEFLGHLVSKDGVRKHRKYIDKVKNFPKPENTKQLRQFLGLINWQRKFAPRCAEIGKPLFALTGGNRNQKLKWTTEMNNSFENLKKLLSREIELAFPDYSDGASPLEVYVDASATGAGACLCQQQQGHLKIILYDSYYFSDCQRQYSTIERELAAIRWGVKTFRAFLYGQYFILHTDHQPLVYLHNMRLVDQRLARTIEDLAEFDFSIQYVPGSCNQAADALSRLTSVSAPEPPAPVTDQPPQGLALLEPVPGGADSMFMALCISYQHLLEEYDIRNNQFHNSYLKLRKDLVGDLVKSPKRYGLPSESKFMKQLKSMLHPGVLPVPEVLVAFAERYQVTVCVHYGFNSPVIYQGFSSMSKTRVHLQCLGGIHYNPMAERRSYEASAITEKRQSEANYFTMYDPDRNIFTDYNRPVNFSELQEDVEIVQTTQLANYPQCAHNFDGAVIKVLIGDVTFCALLDSGALTNIMSRNVFEMLSDKNLENSSTDVLEGIGSSSVTVLGLTVQSFYLGEENSMLCRATFKIVPRNIMDTCILIGKPMLDQLDLSLDFMEFQVLYQNNPLTDMGAKIYAEKEFIELKYLNEEVSPIYFIQGTNLPGVSADRIVMDQENDLIVKRVKTLVEEEVPLNELPKKFRNYKRHWNSLAVENNLLVKNINENNVPVISFTFLVDLILNAHTQNAHIGAYKLYELMYPHVWNPSLRSVINEACFSCSVCQKTKVTAKLKLPPVIKIQTKGPFELVAIDLVSLPRTPDGFIGLLVLVDHYTKWLAVAPIKSKRSAHIIDKLENQLFPSLINLPVRLLSDNGPEFNSLEFQEMTNRLNIHHVKTTAYKPSSNGAVERVNRTIIEFLRNLSDHPSDWKSYLPTAVRIYNHTTHRETKLSPAKYIMTYEHPQKDLPLLSAEKRLLWEEGHPQFTSFKVGQSVLKKIYRPGRLNIHKLMDKYEGPYVVVSVHENKVTYILQHPDSKAIVKVHHSQLKPWHNPPKFIIEHLKRFPLKRKSQYESEELSREPSVIEDTYYYPFVPDVSVSSSLTNPASPIVGLPSILINNSPSPVVSRVDTPEIPTLSPSDIVFPPPNPDLYELAKLPTNNSFPGICNFNRKLSVINEEDLSDPETNCQLEHISELPTQSPLPVLFDPLYTNTRNISTTGGVLDRNMLDWDLSSISSTEGSSSSSCEESSYEETSCEECSVVLSLARALRDKCRCMSRTMSNHFSDDEYGLVSLFSSSDLFDHDFSGFTDPLRKSETEAEFKGTPLALFLSEITDGLNDIRATVLQNRRSSLDRVRGAILENQSRMETSGAGVIRNRPPVIRSPPLLRSRGKAMDLPLVMPKALERK